MSTKKGGGAWISNNENLILGQFRVMFTFLFDGDDGDYDGKENDGGARYVDAFRLNHALHVFPIIKRMR